MEVASFTFEDLHLNLLGNGICVGCLEGEAHIDCDGAILSIDFHGVTEVSGKPKSGSVQVPCSKRNDMTSSEQFVLTVVDHLYGRHEHTIAETLSDWREARREGYAEAAE